MLHSDAQALACQHGDAFYIYDETRFISNFGALLSAFTRHYANTRIAYSYKTNYTPAICQRVNALGGYAEVVSAMEYALARRIGVRPENIVYNGPWKSEESLREAFAAGSLVNLDSARDVSLLLKLAPELPEARIRVGLRCNFDLAGYPDSRFGFDVAGGAFSEAVAAIRALPNALLAGLHCHLPHRELRSFIGRTRRILEVAHQTFPYAPEFLTIGGGFFGHMPDSLRQRFAEGVPDFDDYADAIGRLFAEAYGNTPTSPTLFIEPGTAVVADTFSFVTRVVDIKQVRGKYLACVAGSLFNVSPYSRAQNLPVTVLPLAAHNVPAGAAPTYDIVGYTCIEGDVLSKSLPGPLAIGDFLVFSNVGSYSIVMKPPFILPSVPILLRSDESGAYRVVKRAESFDYIFENFIF